MSAPTTLLELLLHLISKAPTVSVGVCGHNWMGVHLPSCTPGRLQGGGVHALPHGQHQHASARHAAYFNV